MRKAMTIVALVIWAIGLPVRATAQTGAGPVIQTVTVREDAGVAVIAGTGFGAAPAVTISGVPVVVLPGGTDSQLRVLMPQSMLRTSGTYRLTVIDPARRAGDGFVVA